MTNIITKEKLIISNSGVSIKDDYNLSEIIKDKKIELKRFYANKNKLTVRDSSYLFPEITIGNQIWTTQDLKISGLTNIGYEIPQVTATTWGTLTLPAWCYYLNDPTTVSVSGFSFLYNWYCVPFINNEFNPIGYKVPSQDDFDQLINYLGGSSVAGKKLKEIGFTHWGPANTGDDESRYSALGNGYRFNVGSNFNYYLNRYYVWSSTASVSGTYYYLEYNKDTSTKSLIGNLKIGCNIRLMRI